MPQLEIMQNLIRDRRDGVGTKRLLRMDYGWQNLEQAGRNDSLKSLASNEDCTECAAPPQTSNMRDVLSPFAMMISSQLPSTLLPS